MKVLLLLASDSSEKRAMIRQTWLQEVPKNIAYRFIVSEPTDELESDVIYIKRRNPSIPQDRDLLFQSLEFEEKFDWFFHFTDTTYISLKKLHALFQEGIHFYGDKEAGTRTFFCKEKGYGLSHNFLEKLSSGKLIWDDEKKLSELFQTWGVSYKLTEQISSTPYFDNGTITASHCSKEDMESLETMNHEPEHVYHGRHAYWMDDLFFYKNGFFRRVSSSCRGKWFIDAEKKLVLKWDSWGTEELHPAGSDAFIGEKLTLKLWRQSEPLFECFRKNSGLPLYIGTNTLEGAMNFDFAKHQLFLPLPWTNGSIPICIIENLRIGHKPEDYYSFFKNLREKLKPNALLIIELDNFSSQIENSSYVSPCAYTQKFDIWSQKNLKIILESLGFHEQINPLQEYLNGGSALIFKNTHDTSSDPPHNYVTFKFGGERTGNKLFQIAAVYAHALRQGLVCRIPWNYNRESQDLYRLLKSDNNFPIEEGGYNAPVSYGEPCFSYRAIPKYISEGALSGFFQSDKYFQDYAEDVRALYQNLISQRKNGVAGLHIRMGDYLGYTNFYNVLDVAFLTKALSLISPLIHRLVIFSDSPKQALDLIQQVPESKRFELTVDTHPCLTALQEMTSMEELIISCSSFSWWGAWLGQPNKVIIPKKWFLGHIDDYEDVYCDSWIRI